VQSHLSGLSFLTLLGCILSFPWPQTEHVADPVTGKSFEKLHLAGEYTWLSYNQLAEKVDAFATGLVAATGVTKGEPVVIYAETKADWMVRGR
jgi:long-subunit acyl-CoA synthetase (AMP-forming)